MANSTKNAPMAEGKSYISQLDTVGSNDAGAVIPTRHDAAGRSNDGKSARATGPAIRSRATGAGIVVESTPEPSAGKAIRIAVTSSRTAKVTACARNTSTAEAASASAAR